jgi:hypothetical protein
MMHPRFWSCAAVAAVAAAAPLVAQHDLSVLQLNGNYFVGQIGVAIGTPQNPQPVSIYASRGTAVFSPGLSFSSNLAWHYVDAGGAITNTTETGGGTYVVAPYGKLVLDLDPANPGTDLERFAIDPAGDVALAVDGRLVEESLLSIALRKSSGRNNASLQGEYYVAANRFEFFAGQLESGSDKGVVTFDGSGGWSYAGEEQFVDRFGSAVRQPGSASGAYTVANDGALTFGPGMFGGISPDGEVFFFVEYDSNGGDVGLVVGVRKGSGLGAASVAGNWLIENMEVEHVGAAGLLGYSESGKLTLQAQSASGGAWQLTSSYHEVAPSGITSGSGTIAGSFAVQPDGAIDLVVGPGQAFDVYSSANARYLLTAHHDDVTGMAVGVCACTGSNYYGTNTVGTGGFAPDLGMKSFPTLGNANWKLQVRDARGGAIALLPIGFSASPGVPFPGGLLWLDPTMIVANPFVLLSGAPGAAGVGAADLTVAVPAAPAFAGFRLYAQALILDPAAAGGIAATNGFRAEFCR